jgi:uncharacterized repeat protein (TIGR01451 family)
MTGFSSSSRARPASRAASLVGALVVALTPVLALTTRATAAAPSAIACQTSWTAAAGGSWSDPANWSAGVPTASTNACITKTGTYTVHLTGVQNAAALSLGATTGSQTLSIEGTCDALSGELHLGASSTVNPDGAVILTDTGDCQFSWLDQASGTLTNRGTIDVVDSGTTQDRFLYGDLVNTGTINVDATLTSDDGGHTHTNTGTVTIADGKQWNDNDSFWNLGGSLSTIGGGSFTEDSGTFVQGNGHTTGNVFVHSGGLTYTGSGPSTIVTHGDVALSGDTVAGQALTVEGSCDTGPGYLGISAPWTNGGTLTLTDTGDCQYAWLDQMSGTLRNTGTITSADSGTTQARFLYGDLTNAGTISVAATLTSDDGGRTQTNTGTVTIANGARWDDSDSFWNNGGSLTAAGSGSFNQLDGTFVQAGGTTSGVVVNGASLSYRGTGASAIVAHGGVALSGGIATGQTLTIEGTCADGNALVAAGAPVSNAGTITLTDTGNCGSAGLAQTAGTLSNSGTIHVVNSGTTQARQLVGTVANSGRLVLDAGTNTQAGSGTISNSATGTIEVHIASGTKFAQLTSTGPVQLSGTLSIVADGVYLAPNGRQFTIMTCASCTGAFKTITGQAIGTRGGYVLTSTTSALTLTATKAADLSVVGSAPSSVPNGSTFTYSFTVQNNGPKATSSVTLKDTLPASLAFFSVSSGCTHTGHQVTCTTATLGIGSSITFMISVTATATGKVTNSASATAASFDPTPADATAKVVVTVT